MLRLDDIAPTFETKMTCGDVRSGERIGDRRAVQLSHPKDSRSLPCAEARRNDDGSIDMVFYRRLAHRLRQEAMIQFVVRMREFGLACLRGLRRILSKRQVTP
jgi:hypothetical protein